MKRLEKLKQEREIIKSLQCLSFDLIDHCVKYYDHEIECIEEYGSDNPEVKEYHMAKLYNPGCAECLCRVCARNECTDNYNSKVSEYEKCSGCSNCTGSVELEKDCPRDDFVPDEFGG